METLKIVCPECHNINTITVIDKDTSYLCKECNALLNDPFPIEVSDDNGEVHIKGNDIPILLDFHSEFCAPCVAMEDDYDDASLAFSLKVRFLKINTDTYQRMAREYRVSGVPTIIAFKDGEEVNRVSQQLSQVQLGIWAQSLSEL